MNDKELADAVVAIGIGQKKSNYWLLNMDDLDAAEFVRDWRVVGALIEKCEAQCVDWDDLEPGHWRNMNHTSDTPRAISEACVEALNSDKT